MPAASPCPRVVVVGTGHGGLEAVHALRKAPVDVLLVDRNNYHKFQPLLYQVATAGLQPGDIAQPARHLFQSQANAAFRMARVVGVDLPARRLLVEDAAPIPYDTLVLAAGASTAYFGVEGAREYGFPLKNVADAINLRSHVVGRFEAADRDPELIVDGALTFVVVGGGATGVETAGALVELFDRVFAKDFPRLDVDRARVVLVEMSDGVLAGYAPKLRAYARRVLERRGVEVRLEEAVAEVTPRTVRLQSGEEVRAHTTVWAAGVRANPLADVLGVEQTRGGRVVVDETLRLPEHPEVFVVGDMAGATDPVGDLYPQVAQVAIQQGRHAARTIRRLLDGEPPEPFRYRDLGMMATIGRNAAVAQFPSGFTLTGWPAWAAWALVHVAKLVGFRNRLTVMVNWTYNYFTWDRGPRLVLSTFPETDEVPPVEHEELPRAGGAASMAASGLHVQGERGGE
ncbi:MAG: NAD(P)/FAD-dependent oxidoreductase [Rhodothermales bacterium]|nr:NAD(P)/FAD-dependent oxidoreductase [Rhodothermales bacterium]